MDRNQLFIAANTEDDVFDPVAFHLSVTQKTVDIGQYHFSFELVNDKLQPTNDSNCAYLDFEKLTFPLIIRSWNEGDRFTPLGMKGQKKISDFMIDEKIPVNLKKRVLLFESQGEIIWFAGYRISDHYKITSKTTQTLLIKRTENAKPV
jgi:tRNA(Ile)-lysidine synthase